MSDSVPQSGVFPVALNELGRIVNGLHRPECVLATERGKLFAADWRGGVAQVWPDGSQTLYCGELPDGRPLRPTGIALRPDGSFLIADLGEERGGVHELRRDGTAARRRDRWPSVSAGQLGRPHLDCAAGRRLKNISSLAFGGADLRTAYLGCLAGDAITTFRAPVAGQPPVHWRYPVSR